MRYTYATVVLRHRAAYLKKHDPQRYSKIRAVAIDVAKDPHYFIGCGRELANGRSRAYDAERLQGKENAYSCHITGPDILKYTIEGDVFVIHQFEGHYNDASSLADKLWDSSLDESFSAEALT